MSLITAFAIYFVLWWVVLFAVLPFGVRNMREAGLDVEAGHDPGAPEHFPMLRVALITSLVSAAVFGVVYIALKFDWLYF